MPDLSQLMSELVWSEQQTSLYPSWKSASRKHTGMLHLPGLFNTSNMKAHTLPFAATPSYTEDVGNGQEPRNPS